MESFLKNRRRILGAGIAGVASGLIPGRAMAADVLYVNTYGGSWEAAEQEAYFKPFTKETGIEIKTVTPVSFAKLKAQVQTGTYEWDVSQLGIVEFSQAINEGLLATRAGVPPGQGSISAELAPYGVPSVSLGYVMAYRKDKFPNGGPKSWADFWDVKKFPGKRSLVDRSFTALAIALAADGVPYDRIYPLDVDRAFKKLNEIKPHIKVWWDQNTQSQQLITDGEVDMLSMANARAYELVDRGVPVEVVWNGVENYMSYWFVPKGNPRAQLAWKFVEFATQPKQLAEFCNRLPYGPSNAEAFKYISQKNAQRMPTNPEYRAVSFNPDGKWLAPRLPEIKQRWTQWLAT